MTWALSKMTSYKNIFLESVLKELKNSFGLQSYTYLLESKYDLKRHLIKSFVSVCQLSFLLPLQKKTDTA